MDETSGKKRLSNSEWEGGATGKSARLSEAELPQIGSSSQFAMVLRNVDQFKIMILQKQKERSELEKEVLNLRREEITLTRKIDSVKNNIKFLEEKISI